MLAKAKRQGETPIAFGNLDKFGGIHEFQTVQNQFVGKNPTRNFVFAKNGQTFDTAENREAAAKLQEWADKGYFTKDFNGVGYDPAWQQFAKGRGPFTIAGTWITFDALKGLGDKLGFFLMPGREAGSEPVVARRREPAVGDHVEVQERRRRGRLHRLHHQRAGGRRAGRDRQPAGDGRRPSEPSAPVNKEIFAAWKQLNDTDGLTPYMDYATPTFYDDFSGAVQRLLGGKLTPEAFTKAVQAKYAEFTDTL